MCCFSVADVFLEDPPPEKKEDKKEEKVKKNFVLVSDQLNLQPIVSEHRFSAPQFLALSLSFTTSHIINHHDILPSSPGLINQLSLSSHHLQKPFRDGVRHAIHLLFWRRNDTSSAASGQQSLDKPSTYDSIRPAAKRVGSLVKPSCSQPFHSCYCTIFQRESPLRVSASASKRLDKPTCSHFVILLFIQLESPCCLQPILRWQCKASPSVSCPQPVDGASILAPVPSRIPSCSA